MRHHRPVLAACVTALLLTGCPAAGEASSRGAAKKPLILAFDWTPSGSTAQAEAEGGYAVEVHRLRLLPAEPRYVGPEWFDFDPSPTTEAVLTDLTEEAQPLPAPDCYVALDLVINRQPAENPVAGIDALRLSIGGEAVEPGATAGGLTVATTQWSSRERMQMFAQTVTPTRQGGPVRLECDLSLKDGTKRTVVFADLVVPDECFVLRYER